MTSTGYIQSGARINNMQGPQLVASSGQFPGVQYLIPKDKNVRKSIFTQDFWWSPPFGKARPIDYQELEHYENNILVRMITNHIIDSIVATGWEIVAEEEAKAEDVPDGHITEVEEFFKSKTWNESWEETLRRMLPDLLLYDCGVIIKIFPKIAYDKDSILKKNTKVKPVELVSRDGRSFLKDMDVFGVIHRYYQYSFMNLAPNAKPVAFANDEICYLQQRPSSRSPYGTANLQIIKDVVDYLTASISANRAFWENGFFPGMQIDHPDIVDPDELQKRAQLYKETLKGEHNYNKALVTAGGTKITPLQFTNQQNQWIEASEFFNKLVFAVFKINQSELGFTEGVNRATSIVQSEIYKAKGVQSVLRLLEEYINRQIVWKHFHEDVKFKFDDSLDLQDEKQQTDIDHLRLTDGSCTINEIRAREGEELFEDEEFNAPFANLVMQNKIMMGGEEEEGEESYGGWGEEPAEQPGEEETPVEEATPDTISKLTKAVMAEIDIGKPGAAFIPVVVDGTKKRKRQKKEKEEEESTTKALVEWSESTQEQIESDLKRLYDEK